MGWWVKAFDRSHISLSFDSSRRLVRSLSSWAVNDLVLCCSDAFRCYSFPIVCQSCSLSPMWGDDFFLFYLSLSIRISRGEKKVWSDSSETSEHWSQVLWVVNTIETPYEPQEMISSSPLRACLYFLFSGHSNTFFTIIIACGSMCSLNFRS